MYCPLFTGFYDRRVDKNKIFFAKNSYNVYDYKNFIIKRIYVKKFYMYHNEIKIKYLCFGQKTEYTGALSCLLKKHKKKRFKLTNYKCIREYLIERNKRNGKDNNSRFS